MARLIFILQLKVLWIHKDTEEILTVRNMIISRERYLRLGVSKNSLETWDLRIRDVQQGDQGVYMCQINFSISPSPMKSTITQLIVVGK